MVDDERANAELANKAHIMRIERKLENLFERNVMTPFPWLMRDLPSYMFWAVSTRTSSHGRRLLDTFTGPLQQIIYHINFVAAGGHRALALFHHALLS